MIVRTGNLLAAIAMLLVLATATPSSHAEARQPVESFADLAEASLPAVVNISTTQTVSARPRPELPPGTPFEDFFKEFFDRNKDGQRPQQSSSLGSGFVISASGIIVTNNHVIAEADSIIVRFQDDHELPAVVLGRDPKTDLAVLKVESPTPLPYLKIGDSTKIRVGDWVIAIGNPFGLGGSVSAGIISARARDIRSGPYDDYLQTDAAINKGNSGGPMLNMSGEVIGVNSAIFSPTGGSIGIGFAVPTSLAEPIIDQLQRFGETRRGWLGVHIQTVTEEIAESLDLDSPRGALVASVADAGPAKDGGIEDRDVILKFNGKDIDKVRRLPRIVAETKIDQEVDVVVWRDGKKMTLSVTVARLVENKGPPEPEQNTPVELPTLGLAIMPLDEATKSARNIDAEVNGALVVTVDGEGPAAQKDVQPGDVIVEVNQDPVTSTADVAKGVADADKAKRKSVLMLLNRKGDLRFVAIRPKKS
jgi:serine protease Do